jgi:sigma-E factor negative regulatory protein RseB
MKAVWLLLLVATGGQAADPLPQPVAAAWLQRMADAARLLPYEGVFVAQFGGDTMHSLFVANRPAGPGNESSMMAMDGMRREVRCLDGKSMTLLGNGPQMKMERRLNGRHFPDLLPLNATALVKWYAVKLGPPGRVAGLYCDNVELLPKDAFRWGYILCAEKNSALPLKAVMINDAGQPLMQYAFAEIKLGVPPHLDSRPMPKDVPESAKPASDEPIEVSNLPPGFSRVTAVKRHLPNKPGEVEHWVFSDGLTYISLFLEPATKPVETIKGQSNKGMINMLTRQVGNMQAIVLGDAPWPAIEAISMNLEPRQ